MSRHRQIAAVAVCCAACGWSLAARAGEPRATSDRNLHQAEATEAPHAHPPVEMPGDPIVARLPVKVREPRRMLVDAEGRVLIADSAAGRVLRVGPSGSVATLASDLDEPAGLARDSQGNVFVALRAGGRPQAGSIVRIDAAGQATTLVRGLNGPVALAVDAQDVLYVANAGDDTIMRVDSQGRPSIVARSIEAPSALVFHRAALHAASAAKGSVSRIDSDGRATLVADGFTSIADLATGPDGELVVCDDGDAALVAVQPDGIRAPYLSIPVGTRAIAFDRDGNLVAAGGRLRLVVRLITRLSVPCPHCDQQIPLRIRPRKPPADGLSDPI
ncbi:MAG: hypothetical protein WD069_12180 [Planctomycetales bacterium]